MAIPTFQEIMLPLLGFFGDQKVHHLRDTQLPLAKFFGLNSEDIEQTYSITNPRNIFFDRIGWARTFLKKAYLIESDSERGKFKITQRGIDLLANKPQEINVQTLKQYPDFWDVNTKKKSEKKNIGNASQVDVFENLQTPDETIENSFTEINEVLKSDLIDRILQGSPWFFEKLVLELLVKMGYGGNLESASELTKKSNDGGIDGIIKEDKLGLDKIYIQAKRWQGNVGRTELQQFVGAMSGTQKGVFITTSDFNKNALEYVKTRSELKLVLINGSDLVDFMIEYNLGVSLKKAYLVKKIDSDYFEEE